MDVGRNSLDFYCRFALYLDSLVPISNYILLCAVLSGWIYPFCSLCSLHSRLVYTSSVVES